MDEQKRDIITKIVELDSKAHVLVLACYSVKELNSFCGYLKRKQVAEGEPQMKPKRTITGDE